MDIKRILIATALYAVATMVVAYPWHMLWFHDLYVGLGAYTRPEPNVLLGLVSMLIQGGVIAYIFPFYYQGGNPIFAGIRFSLIIGFIIYSVMGFAMAAKVNINPIPEYLFFSLIFQLVQAVITGGGLGFIYRNLEREYN